MNKYFTAWGVLVVGLFSSPTVLSWESRVPGGEGTQCCFCFCVTMIGLILLGSAIADFLLEEIL